MISKLCFYKTMIFLLLKFFRADIRQFLMEIGPEILLLYEEGKKNLVTKIKNKKGRK